MTGTYVDSNPFEWAQHELARSTPGSPVWETLDYEFYSDRSFAVWTEGERGSQLYFTLTDGTYHYFRCPEADEWQPIIPNGDAMRMVMAGTARSEVCSRCGAYSLLVARAQLERRADRTSHDITEQAHELLYKRQWTTETLAAWEALCAREDAWEAEFQFQAAAERKEEKARHALARTVDCPTCGAPAGRNCRTQTGKSASQDHAARVRASQAV